MAEHVDLDLPLVPRHAATVRTVAASLAADAGFSVDAIDDLRLGVNEVVAVLTDVDISADGAARLLVRFELADGEIAAELQRTGVPTALTGDDLDDLATRILRAVVDEFGIDDAGVCRVVKRVGDDRRH
jgi:anti-sigma regulatory factor (Ser/Thr protein kinase)